MINYSLFYKISEVRNILKVDRKFILDCIYHFEDYFNPLAKPVKNTPKKFNLNDIRVLAFINFYWEDNPDYENIKYGLNSNDHFSELYNEMIDQIMPIFQEPNIDETEYSNKILIGGISYESNKFELAKSYKKSGDNLINIAIIEDEKNELFYPAIFCYRHSVELFLKSIIKDEIFEHNLNLIYVHFEQIIKEKFQTEIPEWFKNIIFSLNDFDKESTTFRYGGIMKKDEHFVDLLHLKKMMSLLEKSFKNINNRI